jgi:spore germination cell wall hydrolase CwlJ-like protein
MRAAFVALAGICALAAPARAADAQTDVRREIECLALTIYFEARGEPDIGKLAVGHVVENRAENPLFPDRICDVVKQAPPKAASHCQFSWWCDGASDRPVDGKSWQRSRALARRIFWGYSKDPTGGALWYHADYVNPSWGMALKRGPHIGRHVFYSLDDGGSKARHAPEQGPAVLMPVGTSSRF